MRVKQAGLQISSGSYVVYENSEDSTFPVDSSRPANGSSSTVRRNPTIKLVEVDDSASPGWRHRWCRNYVTLRRGIGRGSFAHRDEVLVWIHVADDRC